MREPHQIGADSTADLDQDLIPEAREIDNARQVGELVEAIVVKVVEELQ